MMGATGEPSGYYPTDSNGLAVQNQPPMACVCYLALGLEVCAPLGYGGCESHHDEEECAGAPYLPLSDLVSLTHSNAESGWHDGEIADSFEPLRRRFGRPCSRWQRWWCHNITCRRYGGMRNCVRIFYCRFFSIIICTCRRGDPEGDDTE